MPTSPYEMERETYDICSAEFFVRDVKHAVQVIPVHDITPDKHGSRLAILLERMLVDQFLGFGT